MAKYQGKTVTVARAAQKGDDGFNEGKSDQVLIKNEDGTTQVVQRSAVTEN